MEISHIEHIGIAVPDLAEAIKYYENALGLKCYKQEVVEDQKVTTAFFKVGVANALQEAEEKGIRLIDKAPRNGADGLHIAFLHPKSTEAVLTELCEDPSNK